MVVSLVSGQPTKCGMVMVTDGHGYGEGTDVIAVYK